MRRQPPPTNQFDTTLLDAESQHRIMYLDSPVELAARYLADQKWQHKANLRMQKSEEFLTQLMSRSNTQGHQNKLLSFHSEILMLGGGDSRVAPSLKKKNKQLLHGRRLKPKRTNPITYVSPLLAPGGPRKISATSRKRRKQNTNHRRQSRPSSASPALLRKRNGLSFKSTTQANHTKNNNKSNTSNTSNTSTSNTSNNTSNTSKHSKRRPQSAHNRYIKTGQTPSEKFVRPYSAALPLKLDLPWMRIKPEPSTWRASWEPTKPLTYTPKQHLKPLIAKQKKKKQTRPNEHRVVEWARQRRELLEPLMKAKNNAANVIQRFFQTSKHVNIRDKWFTYHAEQVGQRNTAAVVVQRHGRGYVVRSRMATIQQKRYDAALVIQSNWRTILSKQRIELFRKVVAMRKRIMAKRIQRGFRNGSVRRGVKKIMDKAGEFGKQSIIKMQKMFRGKIGRRKSAKQRSWLNQMKQSAGAVSSNFRGFFRRGNKNNNKKKGEQEGEEKTGDAYLGGGTQKRRTNPQKKTKLGKAQTPQPRRFGFGFFGKKRKKASSMDEMKTGKKAQKSQKGFFKKAKTAKLKKKKSREKVVHEKYIPTLVE